MTKIHVLAITSVLAAAACGGSSGGSDTSGVDRTKNITTLSTQEVQTFCQWAVESGGGPGFETDCGDGVTVTNDTLEECVDGYGNFTTDCAATVADAEACLNAVNADPCSFEWPECTPLYDCFPQ